MGHIIELVITWAAFVLVVAVVAGAAGFVVRAFGKRDWSNTAIVEGAFAFGVVLGFVALVFYEMFW